MRAPIRVFLVDDHPLVREWLANLLRLEPDIRVCGEAEGVAPALAAMSAQPPDVAVIDLSLKRGSGLDLIKDLQVQLPHVRVVVLSMHEGVADVERALRAGARGYVTKRESTNRIVSAIRDVHAGQIHADPAILTQLAERIFVRPTPAPGAKPAADSLSDREREVFRRLGDGQSTRRIADDLGVSLKTVQTYCARIKEKLALADASELARAAILWREKEER
jgi:DNA-binding NarL/FixJ family response regulator